MTSYRFGRMPRARVWTMGALATLAACLVWAGSDTLRTEAVAGATITVNSTADTNSRDGALTLREAILLATGGLSVGSLTAGECAQVSNSTYTPPCGTTDSIGAGAADTMVSAAPGTGLTLLTADLPPLSTGNDTIDGGGPGNVIDGQHTVGTCFTITSSGNVIKGGTVRGCAVGLEMSSGATGNILGGTSAPERGVVIDNTTGVRITGVGTSGNRVIGSYAGVASDGVTAVANGTGIQIDGGASGNTVGGTTAGEGNAISGNSSYGVLITGTGTNGNTVAGNFIGTNAAGTAALANGGAGIEITSDAQLNVVGGATAGARNVISGNTWMGVEVGSTTGNTVLGNYIGTNAAGTAPIPNFGGVFFASASTANTVGGTAGTTPGGVCTGACNLISGNSNNGVELGCCGSNQVQGNYIGTNAAGTAAVPNATYGVHIYTAWNTIGGTTPAARNVISGNGSNGVNIIWYWGNTVEGNYIGTSAPGTVALPNGGDGVQISASADDNIIGGTTGTTPGGSCTGACNVISGNVASGVMITDSGTTGNQVLGNFIGTNASGTAGVGNGNRGVLIDASAASNSVGGVTPGARNIIAGNNQDGLTIHGMATANQVRGNYIGTGTSGAVAIPNAYYGVSIFGGALNNIIGGVGAGEGNTIALNSYDGVCVSQAGSTGNSIRGNSVRSNGGLGIDLAAVFADCASGLVSPNDAGDPDTGPNNLQNFPVLTLAINTGANTAVKGTLNSSAGTTFGIDFFSSPACDGSGNGEGQVFLGSRSVTTVGNDAAINVTNLPAVTLGQAITATATDPGGNTSEFSQCIAVSAPPTAPLVKPAALSGAPAPGGGTFDPNFDLSINDQGTAVFAATTSGATGAGVYLFFAGGPVAAAQTGEPAPGTGGAGFTAFGPPASNAYGDLAVRADWSSGQGLFLFFAGTSVRPPGLTCGTQTHGYTPCALALQGLTSAPPAVGGTFSAFGPPVINNNGVVTAEATANGVHGIYLFFAGGPVVPSTTACGYQGGVSQCALAVQGDTALGSGTQLGNPVINDVGQVASAVKKGDGSLQGLYLFFAGSPNGLTCTSVRSWSQQCLLADPATASNDGGTFSNFADIALSASGNYIGAKATTTANPGGALFEIPLGGTPIVLATTSPASQLPLGGGVMGSATGFSLPAINDNDQVVARATIAGSPSEGLFLFRAGQPAGKVVVQADSAPATGGCTLGGFVAVALNNVSQVAYVANINAGGTCTSSQAVFVASLTTDTDSDGVQDFLDNCPAWAKSGQALPPWTVPVHDPDCDGFTSFVETYAATDPVGHCAANSGIDNEGAPDRWPVDFNDDQRASLADVLKFGISPPSPPAFGHLADSPIYQRFDLNADGKVSLADVLKFAPYFGRSCT